MLNNFDSTNEVPDSFSSHRQENVREIDGIRLDTAFSVPEMTYVPSQGEEHEETAQTIPFTEDDTLTQFGQDRYIVDGRWMNAGGAGQIRRGYDRKLKKIVAFKLIPRSAVITSSKFVERQEAITTGRFVHPYLPTVYGFLFPESMRKSDMYNEEDPEGVMILEYFPPDSSPSLKDILRSKDEKVKKKVTPELIAQTLAQLGEVLDYLKQENIVHRDLKPANIILQFERVDQDPLGKFRNIKLIDFGISNEVVKDMEAETVGTLRYVPWEEVEPPSDGTQVDHARADVFSVGTILYEMITAAPLFGSYSLEEAVKRTKDFDLTKELTEKPDGYIELFTALEKFGDKGAAVLQVVDKAVKGNPQERYASVTELAAAFQAAIR